MSKTLRDDFGDIDELQKRMAGEARIQCRFRYWYKRISWSCVVGFSFGIKRFIDVSASLAALIVFAPLFALIGALIKLEDPKGPFFYTQQRVGQWGRVFPFPKFRSMVSNADQLKDQLLTDNQHGDSVTFKMKNDPRVTRVGRVIRRLSLDELPQLWCVLKGDMSLVGPRPALPREVALYSFSERRRLDVKPGLTCIWQVSGRGDIPFDGQVRLDEEYINSKSLWMDIKLLFKTIPAVLTGKGAY